MTQVNDEDLEAEYTEGFADGYVSGYNDGFSDGKGLEEPWHGKARGSN